MRVLLLDNYDSYTWILAHLIEDLAGEPVQVFANDALDLAGLKALAPDCIVISPGPGHPENPADFGICGAVFEAFPELPILGVCLGHQGLALAHGGTVGHAPRPVHGRADPIFHDGTGIFNGLSSPLKGTRYHSLVVTVVPPTLRVTARTADGLVMALEDPSRPHFGVQFHPESISTESGRTILSNFLRLCGTSRQAVVSVRENPATGPLPPSLPWRDPEATFLQLLGEQSQVFWLDDATGTGLSAMGEASAVLRSTEEGLVREENGQTTQIPGTLIEGLRARLRAIPPGPFPMGPGLYGWAGYELRRHFGLPCERRAEGLPEGLWMEVTNLLLFDPSHRQVWVFGDEDWQARVRTIWSQAAEAPPADPPAFQNFVLNREKEQYLSEIHEIFDHLKNGDSYEACLTLQAELPPLPPLTYYRWLRRRSPAPYGAFFRVPEGAVASVSPELLLSLRPDGTLRTEPIKGTRAHGDDPLVAIRELEQSEKDQAELLMITDLLRNDLARVAAPGSVVVPEPRRLTVHPTVVHTSAVILATLRTGLDALDALAAVFPGGSITGAPKHRTVAILERLERRPRGVYTGAIGFLSLDRCVLSVAIRTAELTAAGSRMGAGGAIVIDSQPDAEWEEVRLKLGVMIPLP